MISYAPGIKRGSGLMEGWGNWAKISPAPAQSVRAPAGSNGSWPALLHRYTGTQAADISTWLPCLSCLETPTARHSDGQ